MKVFNHMLQQYTIVNEGEELCPECNGKGKVPLIDIEKNTVRYYLRCNKCSGYGKLDWVEKVIGKKIRVSI